MNRQESDILKVLASETFTNQRALAQSSGHSLGVVNRSVKELIKQGYIDEELKIKDKAENELINNKPKNAIILAAGFGMRMVPINTETPKGLLEVKGEILIERIIRQLHEVGINEIYVVVGFMKEKYEYLVDEYGVNLVINTEYAVKNNLFTLNLVSDYISDTYIIPCDIWCAANPFSEYELYSWYMISDGLSYDSDIRVNRKYELVSVQSGEQGNIMLGISYLSGEQSHIVRNKIIELCDDIRNSGEFWEKALYDKKGMIVQAKVAKASEAVEINTYEQLRELDRDSNHLKSDAINIIMKVLSADYNEIEDITVLKKGMTNRSFIFKCRGSRYIMRIPGEGTEQLINRKQEADVYEVIKDKGLCDDIIYINPLNGYKITTFMENAKNCDAFKSNDVKKCMKKLKEFHNMKLKVQHRFDIYGQIQFYETLWNGVPSVYKDYEATKEKVIELKKYIDTHKENEVLTHIDAVPDNFLFEVNSDGQEKIRLIDWEYAGMQDPHVDVAMFCIYSLYDREQVENTISYYFNEQCDDYTRIKIYCYISACGLLWSNWCEYKRMLGNDFGEYSIRQYRYAKEYYKVVQEELHKLGEKL